MSKKIIIPVIGIFLLSSVQPVISAEKDHKMIIAKAKKKGNIAEGKKVYKQFCVTCHGAKGMGDGPAAAAMKPKPANFVIGKFKYGNKDSDLAKIITKGKGSMPPWGAVIKGKKVDDVVAYIRSLKGKK